jgi:hypothetical protein
LVNEATKITHHATNQRSKKDQWIDTHCDEKSCSSFVEDVLDARAGHYGSGDIGSMSPRSLRKELFDSEFQRSQVTRKIRPPSHRVEYDRDVPLMVISFEQRDEDDDDDDDDDDATWLSEENGEVIDPLDDIDIDYDRDMLRRQSTAGFISSIQEIHDSCRAGSCQYE